MLISTAVAFVKDQQIDAFKGEGAPIQKVEQHLGRADENLLLLQNGGPRVELRAVRKRREGGRRFKRW